MRIAVGLPPTHPESPICPGLCLLMELLALSLSTNPDSLVHLMCQGSLLIQTGGLYHSSARAHPEQLLHLAL